MVAEKSSVCRCLGQPLQDPGELGLEAHVEHPVGLVEHQHLDVVELGRPLLQVVDQPARRGDDHLDLVAEGPLLLPHAHAADDHRAADVARLAEALQLLADLQRQLAGRRQHQGRGCRACRPAAR